jgi:pyrroloquinoline quinone biosynthesis protein A
MVFSIVSIMYILHNSTNRYYRITQKEFIMWTTPAATEMRFGFEVTMYVMNK